MQVRIFAGAALLTAAGTALGLAAMALAQTLSPPDIPPAAPVPVAAPVAPPVAVKPAPKRPLPKRSALAKAPAAPPKAAAPAKAPAATAPAPAKAATASAAPAAKVAPAPVKAPPVPAKELFGHQTAPANLAARAIGYYARGCLAGAVPLAIDGPAWQAMRLSRNRYWGHPDLIALVQRLAKEAKEHDGWPGLLVGDISQPRGGPMLTGHASHQIGLDADIWLTPMPPRRLAEKEREELSATSMLRADQTAIDPEKWTEPHVKLIKRAASYPEVERVLVHPAIKKALCEGVPAEAGRAAWLKKVRPIWGHHYHFHIRMACPTGSPGCQTQPAVAPAASDPDGCGKELADWMKLVTRPPPPPPPPGTPVKPPPPPPPPMTLDQLPPDCKVVLESGRK